jgi:hypothetical protein
MEGSERSELLHHIFQVEQKAERYRTLLEEAELYVSAWACQGDALGIPRPDAWALLQKMHDAFACD